MLKMAVVAPTRSASVPMAATENPGVLRRCLNAKRTSCSSVPMAGLDVSHGVGGRRESTSDPVTSDLTCGKHLRPLTSDPMGLESTYGEQRQQDLPDFGPGIAFSAVPDGGRRWKGR